MVPNVNDANVKHFFTSLGNEFFTSLGNEFFTSYGKEFFTPACKKLLTVWGVLYSNISKWK